MNSGQLALGIILGENPILVYQRYSDHIYIIQWSRLYLQIGSMLKQETLSSPCDKWSGIWRYWRSVPSNKLRCWGGSSAGCRCLRKGWGGSTRAYPEDVSSFSFSFFFNWLLQSNVFRIIINQPIITSVEGDYNHYHFDQSGKFFFLLFLWFSLTI